MRNAGLEEAQAGIKIAGRNINNLRYADDTTLMAESKEEIKSLLMKVKEEGQVQFSSVTQSCLTLCDPMNRSTPGLPVHHQLPEFTQTQVHRVSDAIQPSHPLLSPSPPAPNPSQHQIFSNESTLRPRWPKYWSFSFSIIPSKEIPGLISFRMDWLHLLAVQGTLKNLLQHHSSKASTLWCSAFFTVQLSHPYMTTGKTIALTRWTFSPIGLFHNNVECRKVWETRTQEDSISLCIYEYRAYSIVFTWAFELWCLLVSLNRILCSKLRNPALVW